MTIPGFALLALAIPVVLLGELLARRVAFLGRSHIPPPVLSGLLVAVILLALNETGVFPVAIAAKVYQPWWTWLFTPEAEWRATTAKGVNVYQPLLIAFFTCIGLNASWSLVKKGGRPMVLYLVLSTAFVFVQNGLGVALAKLLGQNPLLGLQCGGVSLMGGFGTAAGFAPTMVERGLANAAVIGTAAAAFGVVAGSLVGGPTGRLLVDRKLKGVTPRTSGVAAADAAYARSEEPPPHEDAAGRPIVDQEAALEVADGPDPLFAAETEKPETFFGEAASLLARPVPLLIHLLVLAVTIKAGAWVYYAMTTAGLTFPVYIGAMLVGMILRNVHDAAGGRFISSEFIDRIASVCLAWLLAAVIVSLQLSALVHSAGPMLIILVAQIVVMLLFCYYVVFPVMGRDYEAATMSVGMIGFGLGATSNAVATMKQMTRAYGPSPRAFLIVTVVGAFLIDFTNALVITGFMNYLK